RSGTNSLHGSVFEFDRNNAFDSLGYFGEVGHGGTGSTAPYRRNQFGRSLGGPIKKDISFFFGTYEGLRQGVGTVIGSQVPTAATRQGILPVKVMQDSCTATPNQAFCVPVPDPKIKAIPSTSVCPSGSATCTLAINPLITPYLNLFQAPTSGPNADLRDGTGIFSPAPTQLTGQNYFMTRVDHQINQKIRIFA